MAGRRQRKVGVFPWRPDLCVGREMASSVHMPALGCSRQQATICGSSSVEQQRRRSSAFLRFSYSSALWARSILVVVQELGFYRLATSKSGAEVAVRAGATTVELETTTTLPISETFRELKKQGKVAFIPYLTAGDPDLETAAAAVRLLDRCGADIIELGIPYSDPLADGPIIQAAATRAISRGTNVDSVLTLMREVLPDVKAPVVIFLYYNPLLKRGVERFLKEAKAAGAAGLVVPDLPLEETGKLRGLTAAAGLELVLLTTPTTPKLRMMAISEASQGFVYLVSLTGVTGARQSIESRVEGLLKDIKQATDKPVAVGFGVSTPAQASKLAEWGADGVIIGSAVVKLLGESGSPEKGLQAVEDFARNVRAAIP